MSSRSRRLIPLFVLVAAVALACTDRETGAPLGDAADVAAEYKAAPATADRLMSREAVAPAVTASAAPPQPLGGAGAAAASATQPGPTGSAMIIRTGFASVEVDSLELAIAAVQRIATALGGWVGNTSLSAGDHAVRSATIELKIPSARYEEALAGLTPLGTVESVSSNAEDVGEEFVDLTARAANARRLEERLITLLATRTGKLEDVLNVERELARVREEIERYDGRLRYLRTRVATSTLSVTVHESLPLVTGTPGENVIGEAFKDAWRNFVHFVAAFIASLGTVIPVLLLGALAVLAWRRFGAPRRAGVGRSDASR
jgi:hypothetical protein